LFIKEKHALQRIHLVGRLVATGELPLLGSSPTTGFELLAELDHSRSRKVNWGVKLQCMKNSLSPSDDFKLATGELPPSFRTEVLEFKKDTI